MQRLSEMIKHSMIGEIQVSHLSWITEKEISERQKKL
jgi:hypothetical protein